MVPTPTVTTCGIILIDKPSGMTSHDVVVRVRRATGVKRVGHGGTLDPMATGLLVVMVGPAVRLTRLLQEGEKHYEASVTFGARTDTADAEGRVVESQAVPDVLADPPRAHEIVASLVGSRLQRPPAYSAVKVEGRKAYELARAGHEPDLEPRRIEVLAAELVAVRRVEGSVVWDVDLTVSKGTYIRALAEDLGTAGGTVAHLSSLRRTRCARLSITEARTLEEIEEDASSGTLPHEVFTPVAWALPTAHARVETALVGRIANGNAISAADVEPLDDIDARGPLVSLLDDGERLLAVYRATGESLTPEVVLPGGCV